jgi:hypothetical protein
MNHNSNSLAITRSLSVVHRVVHHCVVAVLSERPEGGERALLHVAIRSAADTATTNAAEASQLNVVRVVREAVIKAARRLVLRSEVAPVESAEKRK